MAIFISFVMPVILRMNRPLSSSHQLSEGRTANQGSGEAAAWAS